MFLKKHHNVFFKTLPCFLFIVNQSVTTKLVLVFFLPAQACPEGAERGMRMIATSADS